MHFLCLEPRETDKSVLKFSKNLVLKFHFLLLGALRMTMVVLLVVVVLLVFYLFFIC